VRTRATRILDEAGFAYDLLEFEAEAHTAAEAAERLGLRSSQLFKTLVCRTDDRRILLALVPGDREVNLRLLARHAGAKRAEMVDQTELMRLVGYIKGGVSPIGTKRACPTFIDGSALTHDRISVSAGVRGLQIWIAPRDLIRVTAARVEDLTAASLAPGAPHQQVDQGNDEA
jgi:Cys-tRNA(Pro)/Cys-tRNA(Cys) deacylase